FSFICSVLFFVCLSKEVLPKEKDNKLTGETLVDYVNKHQHFFKAEYSPKAELRMKHLMKVEYLKNSRKLYNVKKAEEHASNEDIPENFDSRLVWKNCSSITYIRDQSNCGSCWAVSAAETMSDRICIQSGGRVQKMISDVDILSCCGRLCGFGCYGGYPYEAWEYARRIGVVSGGRYREKGVCRPYPFHPCGRHHGVFYSCPRDHGFETPVCRKYCQFEYGKRYDNDKIFSKSTYMLPKDETAIQREIMKNGPVQAAFIIYEDFLFYKEGIYVHTYGEQRGGHAVKLIGWGVENGTNYWTIANSWNDDWGENGYFRILRGVDHCGIESYVVSGEFNL
ncbi:hypothetical protein V3C99_005971, partial [Haemonchus contortus]